MKVLIVSNTDAGGGAANGALRLCECLNRVGVSSTLLVVKTQTSSRFVTVGLCKKSLLKKVMYRLYSYVERYFFKSFSTTNTIQHSLNFISNIDVDYINNTDCDIVNLHWICFDTLNAKDIAKINKPIVWTMHDSWPACGAEHHPNILENDERYKQKYTRLNKPKSTKGVDLCRIAWKYKYKHLHNKKITFTAPSEWEANVLRQSSLFGHRKCVRIPNLLGQEVFKPVSVETKKSLRLIFGLSENKRTICFGAAGFGTTKSDLKGGWYLKEALTNLQHKDLYQIVVFGPKQGVLFDNLGIQVLYTGFQTNSEILSKFYGMCDVFVCPSIIENLPFTILESMSCGLAVVGFNQGGIPDLIQHKKNGYLAKCYDFMDLKSGIEDCFENLNVYQNESLEIVKKDYDSDIITKQYIDLFKEVIKEGE